MSKPHSARAKICLCHGIAGDGHLLLCKFCRSRESPAGNRLWFDGPQANAAAAAHSTSCVGEGRHRLGSVVARGCANNHHSQPGAIAHVHRRSAEAERRPVKKHISDIGEIMRVKLVPFFLIVAVALPFLAIPSISQERGGFDAEEVTIATGGYKLAGTLLLPRCAARPMPAAIMITGSGQQTRDSNIPIPGLEGYRPFKQIAESLASGC